MRIAIGFALLIAGLLAIGFPQPKRFSDKSVVLVKVERGRGSAVHIGNGKFITAAHVVGSSKTVTLSSGKEGDPDFKGSVLWTSEQFDLALIESTEADKLAAAKLSCREPHIGEAIESVGFPGTFGLTHTYGQIASAIEPINERPVVSSNVVLYPGMSGGPTIDKDGYVVAFNNSIAMTRLGQVPALTGLTFLVPALSACKLLARGV